MLVLRLQRLRVCVGKAIARQLLVLLQVSQGFCHLLDWKSAPNPIPFLPVLSIVETELGTGRKGWIWGYWDSCRSPGAGCNAPWWASVLSNLSTQQSSARLPHLYPFLVPLSLPYWKKIHNFIIKGIFFPKSTGIYIYKRGVIQCFLLEKQLCEQGFQIADLHLSDL